MLKIMFENMLLCSIIKLSTGITKQYQITTLQFFKTKFPLLDDMSTSYGLS